MSQVHKRFTSDQVKELLDRYLKNELERDYLQQILGVKKRRFFLLLKQYRENSQRFTIQYHRTTPSRSLSPKIETNILRELTIEKETIEDKDIPLNSYNYSYIKNRLARFIKKGSQPWCKCQTGYIPRLTGTCKEFPGECFNTLRLKVTESSNLWVKVLPQAYGKGHEKRIGRNLEGPRGSGYYLAQRIDAILRSGGSKRLGKRFGNKQKANSILLASAEFSTVIHPLRKTITAFCADSSCLMCPMKTIRAFFKRPLSSPDPCNQYHNDKYGGRN